MSDMAFGIRDEYAPERGAQVLTLWSGPFYETFEAKAKERPGKAGFTVVTYNDRKFQVDCPAPRNDTNFREVDALLDAALTEHYRADGSVQLNP